MAIDLMKMSRRVGFRPTALNWAVSIKTGGRLRSRIGHPDTRSAPIYADQFKGDDGCRPI